MAIIVHEGENTVRKGRHAEAGLDTPLEKLRSEKIDQELSSGFAELKSIWEKDNVYSNGRIRPNNAARVWYETGKLINRIATDYKIYGTFDEQYYWQAISYYMPGNKDGHFNNCRILAERSYTDVKEVGNWSVWRDILDTKEIIADIRVLDWIIEKTRGKGYGHKEIRKIIQPISREIKHTDTFVLSDDELKTRLNSVSLDLG